ASQGRDPHRAWQELVCPIYLLLRVGLEGLQVTCFRSGLDLGRNALNDCRIVRRLGRTRSQLVLRSHLLREQHSRAVAHPGRIFLPEDLLAPHRPVGNTTLNRRQARIRAYQLRPKTLNYEFAYLQGLPDEISPIHAFHPSRSFLSIAIATAAWSPSCRRTIR